MSTTSQTLAECAFDDFIQRAVRTARLLDPVGGDQTAWRLSGMVGEWQPTGEFMQRVGRIGSPFPREADVAAIREGLVELIERLGVERRDAILPSARRRIDGEIEFCRALLGPTRSRDQLVRPGETVVVSEQDLGRRELREARARHLDSVRHRSFYGAGSEHSYVRDRLAMLRPENPVVQERARERVDLEHALRRDQLEQRAISTGTLGAIVPGAEGLPLWTDEAYAAAVRQAAPLLAALDQIPMPEQGVTVPFSKVSAGATAVDQASEDSAVSEPSDLTIAFEDEPLATVSAIVSFSFQARDRSGGLLDEIVARDIGAAWGAKIESDLFTGSGSSGQIRGLYNASPATSETASTATPVGILAPVHDAWQTAASALGMAPDITVMHPQRSAWFRFYVAQGDGVSPGVGFADLFPPGQIVESLGVPTNLGGSTNQDAIWLLHRLSVPIAIEPLTIDVQLGQNATALQGRFIARSYVAFATARRPEGIAVVSGTAFVPPAWT